MIHIGCGTVCFRKLPLDEALRRIAGAGYEYVEPQATAPFCPHVDPWRDDPLQFRRRVAELGFRGASALWAPNGAILRDPDSVRGVSQAVRWASAAGIPVVNCGDGAKPPEMSDADALACLSDRLAEILAVAEACQVYVAIEPHGAFSLTAEGLKKILGLSSSKRLGVNYDAANVRRATYVETVAGAYAWTPFGQRQDEVATLGDVVHRVVHYHAKDLRDGRCVALGEGDVDNETCIALLAEHGYSGVLSLETEGEGTAEECQQLVQRSRKYLLHQVSQLQDVH